MSESMSGRPRFFSLDVLRGYAIINMIVIHFVVYWSAPVGDGKWVWVALNHLTGADVGAAAFLLLGGMGQALSLASSPRPAVSALRGGFLFIIGLLMLLLAWGPARLWEWDILTLFGTAALVLLGLRRLPSWLLLVICATVAGLTPWLRQGIDVAHYWGGPLQPVPGVNDLFPGLLWDPVGDNIIRWNLADILCGYLFMGDFPVFPWIIHPILGLALGRLAASGHLGPAAPRLAWLGGALAVFGMALAVVASRRGGLSPVSDYLAPLSFFPTSFSMLLIQAGVALSVITLAFYFLDYKRQYAEKAGPAGRWLVRVGQVSLSVYFAHYMLIAWPLRLASKIEGRNLVNELASPWLALAVGLGVALATFPLLAWWSRHRYAYGLEWCMVAMGAKKGGDPQ